MLILCLNHIGELQLYFLLRNKRHIHHLRHRFYQILTRYLQLSFVNLLPGSNVKWEWLATTLNPYYEANSLTEMISDDRLIRLTHPRWYFGADGSGDITVPGHVSGLIDRVAQINPDGKLPVLLVRIQ